jgi:hypothetical protein
MAGQDVLAEHHVDARILECAVRHHGVGAGGRALRAAPFLGRLEEEHHGAGQLGAQLREDLCRAEQHRHVRVVPAGMHHARLDTLPHRAGRGTKGQGVTLLDRQTVHVGA